MILVLDSQRKLTSSSVEKSPTTYLNSLESSLIPYLTRDQPQSIPHSISSSLLAALAKSPSFLNSQSSSFYKKSLPLKLTEGLESFEHHFQPLADDSHKQVDVNETEYENDYDENNFKAYDENLPPKFMTKKEMLPSERSRNPNMYSLLYDMYNNAER